MPTRAMHPGTSTEMEWAPSFVKSRWSGDVTPAHHTRESVKMRKKAELGWVVKRMNPRLAIALSHAKNVWSVTNDSSDSRRIVHNVLPVLRAEGGPMLDVEK